MFIRTLSVFSLMLITYVIAKSVFKDTNSKEDFEFVVGWRCEVNADSGDVKMGDSLKSDMQYRNGLRDPSYRWPNEVVPFEFDEHFPQNEYDDIMSAMDDFHQLTCIHFTERSNEENYLKITRNPSGCSSIVGMVGGSQILNIGNDCSHKYVILHELMHSLGFDHEQSRHDRDKYITVLWNNINPEYHPDFERLVNGSGFGAEYTYQSIMHYDQIESSANGEDTMIPRDPNAKLGNQIGLHRTDVQRINNMYNCPNKELPTYGWNSDDIWVGNSK